MKMNQTFETNMVSEWETKLTVAEVVSPVLPIASS
jgi:hypothetical protein